MTQAIIVVLLAGLVGLIWVMVLDTLGGSDHSHDKRQGSALPEARDGEELYQRSSKQSKIAA